MINDVFNLGQLITISIDNQDMWGEDVTGLPKKGNDPVYLKKETENDVVFEE